MIKIGFITANDISVPIGYVTRVLAELDQLKRRNVSVSVLSLLHIKYWKNGAGILNYIKTIKSLGFNACVVPVFPDNQNPLLYKALDGYCTWIIRRFINKERISILHCQATQSAYLGVLAVADRKLPVVYDMHGTSVAEQAGLWKPYSPAMQRLEQTERAAAFGSNAIISVSKALQEYRVKNYPQASPLSYVIPCAVNTEKFIFSLSERIRLRSAWNISDNTPVFVYLGSGVSYQKIDKCLEVFQQVRPSFPDARMLIISPVTDIPAIKKLALMLGVKEDGLLYCSVEHNRVPAYLSACDFGFLLRDDLLLNNVASPTKFGEYLSCGVTVISSPYIDDIKRAIDHHEIGILFDEEIEKLESFVQLVMNNRFDWIQRCVAYAHNHYSWLRYGDLLIEVYGNVLNHKR